MQEYVIKIPANQDEITLYCFVGEALWKIQIVEQALSHSITLKMNPDGTKEHADAFLQQYQRYTLGKAIGIANAEQLYTPSLHNELNEFLEHRNWLVHKAMADSQHYFNQENKIFNNIFSPLKKKKNFKRFLNYRKKKNSKPKRFSHQNKNKKKIKIEFFLT